MGSFSWLKADKLSSTTNIVPGEKIKVLIPKEFGGGEIYGEYMDYGIVESIHPTERVSYDLYEVLAFWNSDSPKLGYEGEHRPLVKKVDKFTNKNRSIGIEIGCYDEDISNLKYPLKIVSAACEETYEKVRDISYSDPEQGFFPTYR